MARVDEPRFIQLVRDGVFEVRTDGTIWRMLLTTRTGNRRPIVPKSAEFVWGRYLGISYGKPAKRILAHRLVWLILVGAIPDELEVNHKNGKRHDNRPDNLELLTHAENIEHAYRELKAQSQVGENNGNCKLTNEQVAEIRLLVKQGNPKRAVARHFQISPTMVRNIVSNRARHQEFPA